MKILILGGTQFVGRHLSEEALKRGHELTLFNRGQTNQDLFPTVEKLKGDRDGNLDALKGKQWDAVIDTCGYVPRVVQASLDILKDACDHYSFISSISAYADMTKAHQSEDAALATLEDESVEDVNGETYGGLKVLCENAVLNALPNQSLIIRPGLIVGPHDPTDRFSYWPQRVARGGEVLAPDHKDIFIQFIDARDLSVWTLDQLENNTTGIYNLVNTPDSLTFGNLLDACKTASQSNASFTWIDADFLTEHKVSMWMDLPLWVSGDDNNFLRTSNARAVTTGLKTRPLLDTVKDTLLWLNTLSDDREWKAGLKVDKEKEVLQAWHSRSQSSR